MGFDGGHMLHGLAHVKSEKSVLKATEAIKLAAEKKGYYSVGTMVSFSKISKEQYECFEQEENEEMERQRHLAHIDEDYILVNSVCSIQ